MKTNLFKIGAICMLASSLLTSCLVQGGRHHRGPGGYDHHDRGHYYRNY